MSAIFKTQGGGGGFFPSIFVTGLSETDTVYATLGNKTANGVWETRTVDETEVGGFLISPLREMGMWTVTATDGVKTKTQDVLIDVATEYEIEIGLYKLWLYREGDECIDVTGGWLARAWRWDIGSYQGVAPTLTRNSDHLLIAFTKDRGGACETKRDVDVTDYSKLCAITSGGTGATTYNSLRLAAGIRSEERLGYAYKASSFVSSGNNALTEVNISELSGSYDIYLAQETTAVTIKLHEVWLE